MTQSALKDGAHPFSGIYAFEVLRELIGDEKAERVLRVEYNLQDGAASRANVVDGAFDFSEGNRLNVSA